MIRQSGFKSFARSFVRPKSGCIRRAREIFFALPLVLDAKEIHHVGVGQDVVDLVRDGDAEFFELARHERARADQRHARAEFEQPENIRARDAAKKDVADDRDMETGDLASLFADGVEVEQAPVSDARARRRRH